ncbi:MAG: TSUP family transporter, partial [Candidatus Zixiibacteriota bacterium]
MLDLLIYLSCGLSAGIVGGYLGIGGGIVMVPFMTLLMDLDIKTAVPVSMTAIVVNSISASNEYLKKNMVNIELALTLAVFTVLGNITGSYLSDV